MINRMEIYDQEMRVKVHRLPKLLLVLTYDVPSKREENGSFEQEELGNALQYANDWAWDYLLDWPTSQQLLDVARPLRRLLRQLLHYYGHLKGEFVVPIIVLGPRVNFL